MRLLLLLVRSLTAGGRARRDRRRPQTSDGRQLFSAGRVIGVVIVSLLLCALLDADSLVASVAQEQFGTSRSVELALVRPFATVSDWTGLDLPHRWVTDLKNAGSSSPTLPPAAAGGPGGAGGEPSEPAAGGTTVLAHPGGEHSPGRDQDGPEPGAPIESRPPRVVTTPPPAVSAHQRVPTPGDPLRVWMAGDSLMGTIAESFEEAESASNDVAVSNDVQIGTGLARPDVLNWPATIAREMATGKPDIVVLVFGANDDQDMAVSGHRVVLGTAAWKAEYARRVSAVMNEVASPFRTLIWLEPPLTARPRINQTNAVIDQVLVAAAATHPGVRVVSLAPTLAPNGVFDEYLGGSSGQPIQVRDTDGVHLTLAGAALVTPLIRRIVEQVWHIG